MTQTFTCIIHYVIDITKYHLSDHLKFISAKIVGIFCIISSLTLALALEILNTSPTTIDSHVVGSIIKRNTMLSSGYHAQQQWQSIHYIIHIIYYS